MNRLSDSKSTSSSLLRARGYSLRYPSSVTACTSVPACHHHRLMSSATIEVVWHLPGRSWWTIRTPERMRRWDCRKCLECRDRRVLVARMAHLGTLVLYDCSVLFPIACFTPSPVDTRIEVVLSRACPMLSRRNHHVGRQAVPPHGKVGAVMIERV